jgi:hypothetical protein
MWTALSLVYIIKVSPSDLKKVCPGTWMWSILMTVVIFTTTTSIFLLKITLDAQSGVPIPGRHWSKKKKWVVVVGFMGLWGILWILTGVSTLSSCPRNKLTDNHIRMLLVVWFYTHAAVAVIAGITRCAELAYREYEQRKIRRCQANLGIGGGFDSMTSDMQQCVL